jgi:U4/U6.U5 tri-snRNP-associated protein 1
VRSKFFIFWIYNNRQFFVNVFLFLRSVKTIADSDDDNDDSAASWLKKLKEKEEAQKKAKLLEEMDEQIDQSIESESRHAKKGNPQTSKQYSTKDLAGLRIEHDQATFKEGQELILTLKDKSILKDIGDNLDIDEDEEGDVLVNVNIADDERAAKNVENKKKKPDYKPYEEFDEDGNVSVFLKIKFFRICLF